MGHPKGWIYKNHLFTGSWADGIKIKLIHSIKEMGLQQMFEKMIENLGRSVWDRH